MCIFALGMKNYLHIEELRRILKNNTSITTTDIIQAYRIINPDIPISTARWRIHSMVKHGLMQQIGRGEYRFGETSLFVPNNHPLTERLSRLMRREFPYAAYCQWDMAIVNSFSHYLINYQAYFLDVEHDALEAVYRTVKGQRSKTILYSKLDDGLSEYDKYVVVRPLVTGAPLQIIDGTPMATIEKILVDLACEKMFRPFQDGEIVEVFSNALSSYTVNISKMLRYAGRRGRRQQIQEILNEIN